MKLSAMAVWAAAAIALLLFPVSVVALAFVSFAFGGHCAAWQWWLAAAIAVSAGFWRRPVRDGLRGGLLFLAWLAVVWVGCGVIAGAAWFDEVVCHYPAVRMLADGWNPLFARTPEAVLGRFGLESGDLRIDHILFMPKTVWVFNAVAWFFTRDVLNPMAPILWFLFPAVTVRIWRSMGGAHFLWKALAVPILYCLVPNTAYAVDSVVALSAIGLLLAFEEVLSRRGFDPLSLVVFSFWMMGAKPTGLVHGGVFWLVFLAFAAWRRKDVLKRLTLSVAAPVAALLVLACSTPYLTSVCDYGHPFYPKYTSDERRFPARDITDDFIARQNDDAASMGYFGRYVNSFVSPSLARAWYRWRLGRPDFMPYSQPYTHYPNDAKEGNTPTRLGMRLLFWISVAWLLSGAGRSWRIPALCVLLCMGVAPPPMLGYVRYIPWWLAPALFVYVDLAAGPMPWRRRVLCPLVLAFVCFLIRPHTLSDRVIYAETLVERREMLCDMFKDPGVPPALRPAIPQAAGHLKLMFRDAPQMSRPELLPHSERHQEIMEREGVEISALLFALDDMDEMRRRAYRYPCGTLRRAAFALRVAFVTLPRLALRRIAAPCG